MSMRKFKVGMAAVLILGIVVLFFVVNAFAQSASERLNCPSGALSIFDVQEGINVECVNAPFATLTPVIVSPTDTPIPPTDTPVSPTDTPVPGGPPFAGAPLCPSHDNRAFHGLWDTVRQCHYVHEHGMDPHAVDDIFGTQLWDWAGGDISYPWETPDENLHKHEAYEWLVFRDLPCPSGEGDLCVKAGRGVFHVTLSGQHATTRFHSLYRELLICEKDGSNCGIKREGGWACTGGLKVDGVPVPLASDGDDPGYCNNNRKEHQFVMPEWFEGHASATQKGHGGYSPASWYYGTGAPGGHQNQVITNRAWGPVDPDDPFEILLHCPDYQCIYNASRIKWGIVSGDIHSVFDPDEDGTADVFRWVTRYGVENPDCTGPALDCVPYSIESVPVGNFVRIGVAEVDGDISPEGEWWIRYPN